RRQEAGFGGVPRLLLSVLLESAISVLLAPIRMLAHSRYVLGGLFNVSLHWGGQNRTEATSWRQALVSQLPGTLAGLGWSGFAWSLDPLFFLWSLPVTIPLLLAAPTSVLLSRNGPGRVLRNRRLLLIPEEASPSRLLSDATDPYPLLPATPGLTRFEEAVLLPRLNHLHRSFARDHGGRLRRQTLDRLVNLCLRDGPQALSRAELSQLSRDRSALADLHTGAWRARPDSYWGRRLAMLAEQPAAA
ncbi:MAG: glucans biosynthesis glucosyltransferase MdoH, partial [Marinobacter sp.]|nr:glucans biosynthesis glucosyltransferase MdoH [Marinobacter sp.]